MYLRNSWYVAGWSSDLRDEPLARTMLDERIVLYRGKDGGVAALEDRCPNRHLPLSMGRVVGDALQCGYHGLTFDRSGACIAAPNQAAGPPRRARARAYPALERFGFLWVWMGEPARADAASLPDFQRLTDPGYAAVGKTNYVRCGYRLVADNLLDLSHVGFVHSSTIGNAGMGAKGTLKARRTERGVQVTRLVPEVLPPPAYVKLGKMPPDKNIDRWQVIDFIAPSFVLIHAGGAEAGTGALEGRYAHGLNLWVFNAMTPETATTTHYHWASARNHALDDPAVSDLLFAQLSEAFEEDRRVLEAQQEAANGREDDWSLTLQGDAGSIQARRVLDELIEREKWQPTTTT